MTDRELQVIANDIETLLDRIEEFETEKAKAESELNSTMKGYKSILTNIKYWEDTGLEYRIDSLEGKISSLERTIINLESQL